MMNMLKKLVRDEEGQGLTEYALIIALIAIVVIVALTALGGQIRTVFNRITGNLQQLPAS